MTSAIWFALVGALLIGMTIVSAWLKRLSLTAAILYMIVGVLAGRGISSSIVLSPLSHTALVNLLSQLVIIVSLFAAGLKLRLPLGSPEWKTPILLSTVSMVITILIVALLSRILFSLSWGGAIVLGAILAPTDPVLAASVQVLGPADRDRLRFSLTAEAGLNDGTALPFVLLGLYLLDHQGLAEWGLRWLFLEVVWGIVGGLAAGTLLGAGVSRLVVWLRKRNQETSGLDDFLALGLIGLSYGVATILFANGFLSVFAAGLALRRSERRESRHLQGVEGADLESRLRTDTVSGHMAHGALEFIEQLGRFGEFTVVILIGAMLVPHYLNVRYLLVGLGLLLIARPISVFLGVPTGVKSHKFLLSWFGIRGVGSLYYLTLVLQHGIPETLSDILIGVTFSSILISIFIHGLSSGPLMIRHSSKKVG